MDHKTSTNNRPFIFPKQVFYIENQLKFIPSNEFIFIAQCSLYSGLRNISDNCFDAWIRAVMMWAPNTIYAWWYIWMKKKTNQKSREKRPNQRGEWNMKRQASERVSKQIMNIEEINFIILFLPGFVYNAFVVPILVWTIFDMISVFFFEIHNIDLCCYSIMSMSNTMTIPLVFRMFWHPFRFSFFSICSLHNAQCSYRNWHDIFFFHKKINSNKHMDVILLLSLLLFKGCQYRM